MDIKKILAGGGIATVIALVAFAGIQMAAAALTFNGTSITGDSNSIIDATGTISIGASSATGITIGQSGQTVLFPGNVSSTNLFTGIATTTNLTITALGAVGSPCLTVNAAGNVATTTCGSGVGSNYWSATSTGIYYNGTGTVAIGSSVSSAQTIIDCPLTDTILQCVNLLPSGGVVTLENGTYQSGMANGLSSGNARITTDGITIRGKGPASWNQSTSSPGLTGAGTIIRGPIYVSANGFSVEDLGIDVGTAVIAAAPYSGTGQDGIGWIANAANTCGINNCLWQYGYIKNVIVVGTSPTALFHGVLATGINRLTVDGLTTYFGTHGIAPNNNSNLEIHNYAGHGHNGDCLILKTGDAMTTDMYDVNINGVTCSAVTTGDTGYGILLNADTGGSIHEVNISDLTCIGLRDCLSSLAGNGNNISNITVKGIVATGSSTAISMAPPLGGSVEKNWDIGNGVLINTGGTIALISLNDATATGIHIHDMTLMGSQGLYTAAASASFSNIVYTTPPSDNRFLQMASGTITNVTGFSSGNGTGTYSYLLNGAGSINNCTFSATTNLTASAYWGCTFPSASLTAPPSTWWNFRGGTGSTYDMIVQNASGTKNTFLVNDSGLVSMSNGASFNAGGSLTLPSGGYLIYPATNQYSPTYFNSSNILLSPTAFGGLPWYSTSTPPTAATPTQVANLFTPLTNCGIAGYVLSPASGGCVPGGSSPTYNFSDHTAWISGATYTTGVSRYFALGVSGTYGGTSGSSAAATQSIATSATTLQSLYVRLGGDIGVGNTIVFTVYDNGTASSVTCTVTGNGSTGSSCTDTTHTLTVAAGDLLSLSMTPTGTISTNNISYAVQW
jgi:hypothetical protein